MTKIDQNKFNKDFQSGIDIDNLSENAKATLKNVGIDLAENDLDKNGKIDGEKELKGLFKAIDKFDQNGSSRSFETTLTSDPNTSNIHSVSGVLYETLKSELKRNLDKARMQGPAGAATPKKEVDKNTVKKHELSSIEPKDDEIEIKNVSKEDAHRKHHLDGLQHLSVEEIKKQISDTSPEQVAYVMSLLTGKDSKDAYTKVAQALKEYVLEDSTGGVTQSLSQAVKRLNGPGAGDVRGDFAAILQHKIEKKEHKPMDVSYMELLTDLVKSDPGPVVERLENIDPSILTRIMTTMVQIDGTSLGLVVSRVATRSGESYRRLNEARANLVEAQRSGDPERISQAQTQKDTAEQDFKARGNDLGFAYGSARNAIDGIKTTVEKKVERELEVLYKLNNAIDLVSLSAGKPISAGKSIIDIEVGVSGNGLGDSLLQEIKKRDMEKIVEWHKRMDLFFATKIADAYSATATSEERNAGIATKEGKQYENRQDEFENAYHDGMSRARSKE